MAEKIAARSRYAILCGSLLASLFLYRFQSEVAPVPQSAVVAQNVVARYIGPMDAVRTRKDKDFTRRDAGIGMEYSPGDEPEDSPLPTVRRAVFSDELSLTPADLKLIGARGPRYTIGVVGDEILTISGVGGAAITYPEYAQRISVRRRHWLQVTFVVAVAGFAVFFWGHWLSRRQRTDA